MTASSESRKRSLEGKDDTPQIKRSILGKPVLKFLVQNYVAGKLIGKGGSALAELQSKYDLSIKLSPSKEFYPGTSDRIVCVIGDIENIIEFGNYLINDNTDNADAATTVELKLLISNEAAGFVLGKGGAQMKTIQSESDGAKISMDKKGENLTGERVVRIMGDESQIATAFNLVMETLTKAKDKISTSDLKYPSPTAPVAPTGDGNFAPNFGNAEYKPRSQYNVKFYAEMEIPDELVGTVLGKGGQRCLEINRSSGARLQFSKKDEFVEGTKNRLLTITGSSALQVQNAYALVDQALPLSPTETGGNHH